MANMVPLEIQATARRYKFKGGNRLSQEDIEKKWQVRWNEKGPTWTKALIPVVRT